MVRFTLLFLFASLLPLHLLCIFMSHLPLPLHPSPFTIPSFPPNPFSQSCSPIPKRSNSQQRKRTPLTDLFHQVPPAGSASSCSGAVLRPSRPSIYLSVQALQPFIPSLDAAASLSIHSVSPFACTTPKQSTHPQKRKSHPTSIHITHIVRPFSTRPGNRKSMRLYSPNPSSLDEYTPLWL